MKRIIILISLVLFILIVNSCKKEDSIDPNVIPVNNNPPIVNKPPVADAGVDINFAPENCINFITVNLNGSKSADPEGNINSYVWKKLWGPGESYMITNPFRPLTSVSGISIGEHAFELTVKDTGSLESRDTVLVILQKGEVKEYDIDVNMNSLFSFFDNAVYTDWDLNNYYLDETQITVFIPIDTLGEFKIHVFEAADTAELSDKHDTYINLNNITSNSIYLSGVCSVNFKKLIREGGGAFTGTLGITEGSAAYCEDNVFKNLPPLTVTGTLDVATRMINLKIVGKVFF